MNICLYLYIYNNIKTFVYGYHNDVYVSFVVEWNGQLRADEKGTETITTDSNQVKEDERFGINKIRISHKVQRYHHSFEWFGLCKTDKKR